MKLDYDLLKQILEHIEEVSDGQTLNEVGHSADLSSLGFPCESFDGLAYHFDILAESGFVRGDAERLNFRGDRAIMSLRYYGLTLAGHQLLDGMRQHGIWNKIRTSAEALGIGGLKQIPGLAVAPLTSGA